MISVSVIIPTWNRAQFLKKAIDSVLLQGDIVGEILICDDGSTDNSKEIVDGYGNDKIKWLDCGRNGKPSVPRNIGIENSVCDWIAFLDSDDMWVENKLKFQFLDLQITGNKFSCTNALRVIDNIESGLYFDEEIKKQIIFEDLINVNKIICSSVLLHKDLLRTPYRFPEVDDHVSIEDYALWLRISINNKISYLSYPLVKYSDEPTKSLRKNFTDVWKQKEVVFLELEKWLIQNSISLTREQIKILEIFKKRIDSKGKVSIFHRIKNKFL